jgi:RHS repeat-associated core domain
MKREVTTNISTSPPALATLTDTIGVMVNTTDTPRLTTAFDASNRTWTSTTTGGRSVIAQVDDKNKLILSQVSGLNSINYAYYPSSSSDYQRGKISTITTGDRQYSFTYHSAGQRKGLLQTVQDPLGRTVSFDYDANGRVTSQTLPDLRVIGFGYDNNGNVTSVTPPTRPAHGFKYNAVDQAKEYDPPTPPTTGVTQYLYNNDHQLTNVIRPDLQALTLNYNATTGKLDSITAPNGNTGYSYDPTTGNLASITTPDVNGGVLSYTYDGLLPVSETWSGGSVVGNVSWTYDNDFNIATETVVGSTINLTYDIDGLLLTGAGALAIGRNQSNGLITSTLLDNVSTSVGYDDFGVPTLLNVAFPSNAVDISFIRDKLGRITQKTETINSTSTTYNYEYDPAGRLTDICVNGYRQTHYGYDANSNRTLKRQCAANIECQQLPSTQCSSGTDVTGTYDDQDRMTAYGNTTYGYTLNGELLSKTANGQTTIYQYDVFGNLRSVSSPAGTIDYVIDGRNRRIGKKVNSTLVQGFLYDGQLRIVAELDENGILKSRFVYGTKVNVPEYMIQGGVTYRIITDHLGSPRFVVNSSTGAIAQQMNYDEFGNITSDSNPGFQPFGFAGGLYDRDTGLVRFGARDYDPVTGRWTKKDPIGFRGGDMNLYGYVLNEPTSLTDYNGLTVTCTYSQSSGAFTCTDDTTGNQVVNETGYAGTNTNANGQNPNSTQGRNNSNEQCTPYVGPLPQGSYTVGTGSNSKTMGPNAIPLTPNAGNNMCNRSGFYIHGNNAANDASSGCIIMGPGTRNTITNNGGGTITVTQ